MVKAFAVIGLSLILTGCTTSTATQLPDGRPGYAIKCGGGLNSWGGCMQEAARRCGGRGYQILLSDGRGGFVATQTFAGSIRHREMIVACK